MCYTYVRHMSRLKSRVSVFLDDEDYKTIKELADKKRVKAAQLIRDAIYEYIKREG